MPNGRNVLFLCTGNSARSIMAEALLTRLGDGRIRAHSAGSRPAGRPNPFAVELLRARGHAIEGLRSKSWDEFAAPEAPRMDVVVTVCDAAAGEACPIWPGQPLRAHWSLPDPAAAEGSDDAKRRAFEAVYRRIEPCVAALAALPFDTVPREELARRLKAIAPPDEG
jgi:arsenate reductase (thioredoxin)